MFGSENSKRSQEPALSTPHYNPVHSQDTKGSSLVSNVFVPLDQLSESLVSSGLRLKLRLKHYVNQNH